MKRIPRNKKFKVPVGRVVNPVLKILKTMKVNGIISIETGMVDDQFVNNEATIVIKVKRYEHKK
jgi:hypothetical protein